MRNWPAVIFFLLCPLFASTHNLGVFVELPNCQPSRNEAGQITFLIDSAYTFSFEPDSAWILSKEKTLGVTTRIGSDSIFFEVLIDHPESYYSEPIKKGWKSQRIVEEVMPSDTSKLFKLSRDAFDGLCNPVFQPIDGNYTVFPFQNVIKKFEESEHSYTIGYVIPLGDRYTIYCVAIVQKSKMNLEKVRAFEKSLLAYQFRPVE